MKKRKSAATSNSANLLPPIDLRAMELEVLEEGKEWMRRRLQEKLQQAARETDAFSPEERTKT